MFNLEKPRNDFFRVRDGRESMPLWMDIDLSTSRSITGTGANAALSLNISGNSFFVDADNTNVGNAVIHFQDTSLGISSAPFYAAPGFVASVPFTQILIENAAQAGKRLRIFYGVDLDFRAGVNASVISGTVTIGNPTSAPVNVSQSGFRYTGSYKSITVMAANTPDVVFAPGANVNGAIVWSANHYVINNAAAHALPTLLAKNGAPVSVIDGDVIASAFNSSQPAAGAIGMAYSLGRPVFIAAGLGLYAITSAAESLSHRNVLYTLL